MQFLLPLLALVAAASAHGIIGVDQHHQAATYAHEISKDASKHDSNYDHDGSRYTDASQGAIKGGHKLSHEEHRTATKHNIDKAVHEVNHEADTSKAAEWHSDDAAALGKDHGSHGSQRYHDSGASGHSAVHQRAQGQYDHGYGAGYGVYGGLGHDLDAHSSDQAYRFAYSGDHAYGDKDQGLKHKAFSANAGFKQSASVKHKEIHAKDNEDYHHHDESHKKNQNNGFQQAQQAYADKGYGRYGYNDYAKNTNSYISSKGHQSEALTNGDGYGYGGNSYSDYAKSQAARSHQDASKKDGLYNTDYADAASRYGAAQKSHLDEENQYYTVDKKSYNTQSEIRHSDSKSQDSHADVYGQYGNHYNDQDFYAGSQAGRQDAYSNYYDNHQNQQRYAPHHHGFGHKYFAAY